MNLILYSKSDCCLCAGLLEKIRQIQDSLSDSGKISSKILPINLDVRDINSNQEWLEKYQCEVPVLCVFRENQEQEIPRISPRASANKLQEILENYI